MPVVSCVSNHELLNGPALGHAQGTADAGNRLRIVVALWATTAVPSFLGHLGSKYPTEDSDFYSWQYVPQSLYF